MERWANKVAVVTGASVGIGASIAVELTKAGMIVVGLARRPKKTEALKANLPDNVRNNLHAMQCDVSKEEEIVSAFQKIDEQFGGISVLVNNAGVLAEGNLLGRENADDLRNVVNVNLYGVLYCTREAYSSMKKHNIDDGHIININSVAGHMIPFMKDFSLNIYPATKHAVTALTEVYRQDLVKAKSKIRVTSISPGAVKTEIFKMTEEQLKLLENISILNPKDVADTVLFVIGMPPHVQIHEIIIRPVGEEF